MEKQTEKIKCQLAKEKGFNLFQIFQSFDLDENGYTELEHFIPLFINLTMKCPNRVIEEQAELIFMRYDTDDDHRLTYTEFC